MALKNQFAGNYFSERKSSSFFETMFAKKSVGS